jgi:hypothetical protein
MYKKVDNLQKIVLHCILCSSSPVSNELIRRRLTLLQNAQWQRYCFKPGFFAGNKGDILFRAAQGFGEEGPKFRIGFAVLGGGGNGNFQPVSADSGKPGL